MNRLRLTIAGLVFASATAALAAIGPPPASAATCNFLDQGYVHSGVSEAYAYLYYCYTATDSYYQLNGSLYDRSCDNRAAYLDVYYWVNDSAPAVRANGCGARTPFDFRARMIPYYSLDIRTRACNTTCSSSDWDTLYF